MQYPGFFAAVPPIKMRDPLAQFLGAAENGIVDYSYLDAVKLAGHSCPTVASAYWLTALALKKLYGDELPERGAIRVEFRDDRQAGVTGVIANVVALLTGAAGDGGFKGLGGRFDRRDLLLFDADIPLDIRFGRLDNGDRVDAVAHLREVPAAPEMPALMQRCLNGQATASEQQRFGELWQDRVRRILTDHQDDPSVFVICRSE